jgi:peptidoglycan/LPS O-acetylase OafA/YrhL
MSQPPIEHYRADIDGLRAVAVLSVLAFHAFPSWAPGGFVGVDIFFVISGYLISGIIFGRLATGRFTFLDFYQRRIRRIFPALLVMLATVLAAGWFLLTPSPYAQLGKHVAGGAAFVSNLVLWSESGYFDQAAGLKPLLHLWSLGIEEQFYLAWPLLLWATWRWRTNALLVIGAIFAASLAASIWLSPGHPTASFYAPVTRFWELALGTLLAAMHTPARVGNGATHAKAWFRAAQCPPVAHATSLLGAALLLAALLWLDDNQPFPGWRALVPTIGTCLLLAAGPNAFFNRRVLSRRVVVWVGLVSYPLYLWHWPILAFQNLKIEGPVPASLRGAALAVAFVLAAGTYYLVERPIRFGSRTTGTSLRLGAAMTAAAICGLLVSGAHGFVSRMPAQVQQYADYQYDFKTDARYPACWLTDDEPADAFAAECVDRDGARPLLVVWGDSHAARLFPGLREVTGDQFRLAQFTRNSCMPLDGSRHRHAPGNSLNCMRSNRYVMSRIREMRPDTVVLFAHWQEHWSPALLDDFLIPTLDALHASGVPHVIVVGPAPQWRKALPENLIDLYQLTGAPSPVRTRFGLVEGTAVIDASMRDAMEAAAGARYFSAFSAMCDQDGCLTRTGTRPSELTTWDYGHLTTAGARYVARALQRSGAGLR